MEVCDLYLKSRCRNASLNLTFLTIWTRTTSTQVSSKHNFDGLAKPPAWSNIFPDECSWENCYAGRRNPDRTNKWYKDVIRINFHGFPKLPADFFQYAKDQQAKLSDSAGEDTLVLLYSPSIKRFILGPDWWPRNVVILATKGASYSDLVH